MTTSIDYALLAGAAYFSNRNDINRFPIPNGWSELVAFRDSDPQSGFEARAFQSGSEIVVSYAGTDFSTVSGFAADSRANAALGTGAWSLQLLQAAEYYLKIKAANPGVPVTLTGHSLGGGLAALVGVFFGVPTKAFDQAPFAASAGNLSTNAARLKTELAAKLNPDGSRQYSDAALAPLTEYLLLLPGNLSIPRASLVDTIRVEGELLDGGLAGESQIGGTSLQITHGTGANSIDLHSQALLTAFLQSTASATASGDANKSLGEVSKKLSNLLKLFFDSKLFAFPTAALNDKNVNFLEQIVRHEAGVQGSINADAMVTRFTKDLWKLAQDGGLTLSDGIGGSPAINFLSKTLTAFAMQFYYENSANATNQTKYLFSDVTGGVLFDMADVSKDFATAFTNNTKADLTKAKGLDYAFNSYLAGSTFTASERSLIKSMLPYLRDWYVQAGTGGLAITDVLGRGAFMLGGAGSDALVGGSKVDLLVGNAGDDVLQGRGGNDMLLGGLDNDTYIYQTGDGLDTILDRDGNGSIQYKNTTLAGGAQYGDNRVSRDAQGHVYTNVGGGRARPCPRNRQSRREAHQKPPSQQTKRQSLLTTMLIITNPAAGFRRFEEKQVPRSRIYLA
jgi:Ca2+-binding RTX toxin-like protein